MILFLVNSIWQEGAFRFRNRNRYSLLEPGSYAFQYYCSQNQDIWVKAKGENVRDKPQMDRCKCGGLIALRLSFQMRTLTLKMVHSHHKPYVNIMLQEDSDVVKFNDHRIADQTPSHIFRNLRCSKLPECDLVLQHQVYHRWYQGNASHWRRHLDQLMAAMILVQQPSVAEVFESQVFKSGNIRGLALFSRKPMEVLRRRTKEMTMDSTYGTNHLGSTPFAVLAEVDGTGIPLAYCFVDKLASANGTVR